MDWVGIWVLVVLVSMVCGAYVSTQKDRPMTEGVLFALLLGPIGVLVAAELPHGPRYVNPPLKGSLTDRRAAAVSKRRFEEDEGDEDRYFPTAPGQRRPR